MPVAVRHLHTTSETHGGCTVRNGGMEGTALHRRDEALDDDVRVVHLPTLHPDDGDSHVALSQGAVHQVSRQNWALSVAAQRGTLSGVFPLRYSAGALIR